VRRIGAPMTGYRTWRDFLSWVAGVTIIAHEVWYEPAAELYVLIVGVALTGLPLVLPGSETLFGRDSQTHEHEESATHEHTDHATHEHTD
jgi:hypothetical protein